MLEELESRAWNELNTGAAAGLCGRLGRGRKERSDEQGSELRLVWGAVRLTEEMKGGVWPGEPAKTWLVHGED